MGFPDLSDRWKSALPTILSVAVMVGMVFAAEAIGIREILFPEIAALCFGALLAPRRAWMVSKGRMLLLMSCCAFIGYLLSVYLPFPYWAKIAVAFVIAQIIYLYSGTSLAPLVSAIVLPVVLQTDTIVYPIAAACLTLLVIICRSLLEHLSIRQHEPYQPLPRPDISVILMAGVRIVVVTALAYVCTRYNCVYVIAPPVLVLFTELCTGRVSRASKSPVSTVLFVTMCALAGASARELFSIRLGLPLTVAAFAAAILAVIIVYIFNLTIPPAGACCMLAFLVPEASILTYPIQILAGASLYMLISLIAARIVAARRLPFQS